MRSPVEKRVVEGGRKGFVVPIVITEGRTEQNRFNSSAPHTKGRVRIYCSHIQLPEQPNKTGLEFRPNSHGFQTSPCALGCALSLC